MINKLQDIKTATHSCKLGYNTRLYVQGNFKAVQYHQTDIVKIYPHEIVLDNGGYFTVSTKQRINIVLAQYGIDKRIVQRDFKWYIGDERFYNGYVITLKEEN